MSELLENPADRVNRLKTALRAVATRADVPAAQESLAHLLKGCDACLVAQAEDELIREGVSVEQLTAACDHHAAAVRESLPQDVGGDYPAGHPIETFRSENVAIKRLCGAVLKHLPTLLAEGKPIGAEAIAHLREVLNQILDLDKHYLRKEHLLFTCLERHGITGPSKVMWAKDDEIRTLLGEYEQAIDAEITDAPAWRQRVMATAQAAMPAVIDMIFKEEQILLPMAAKTLTENEWVEIWAQSPQFGWCIVDPGRDYRPSPAALLQATAPRAAKPAQDSLITRPAEGGGVSLALTPAAAPAPAAAGAIMFPTGALTLEQLIAIFNTMPVDLTFVDADDRVRFFSEGAGRLFVRPKAVIGRKVQHCHPPKSLHLVDQILDDFKAGTQSVAEFWITMRGRFVHIRYFALRDEGGTYLGTLEVTQDLTRERTLEGERRLVAYDN